MAGRILIGTQGWNYAAWVGPFYPEGTRPADFLSTYGQAFGTVEVDSTFYAVPPAATVRGWAERAPDGFVFALKLPQEVTHERRLRGADDEVALFLERARLLEEKLGPVLVQLGPDFSPRELGALEGFLPRLPGDVRFAVEVRHPRWMRPEVLLDLLSLLAAHGVALALTDGRWIARDTMLELVQRPTAGFHYLRWMGPDPGLTDYSRVQLDRSAEMDAWAAALREPPAREMDLYGYANNHFAGHSPASARDLQRRLGIRPVPPGQIGAQISLF
ncbi:MAG TPA: DUF72 domain-containing protein [Longimicrobiaceae bacterium]|nr:DUF72 domain-containing protein [Longimicrobiaceae bacterium]